MRNLGKTSGYFQLKFSQLNSGAKRSFFLAHRAARQPSSTACAGVQWMAACWLTQTSPGAVYTVKLINQPSTCTGKRLVSPFDIWSCGKSKREIMKLFSILGVIGPWVGVKEFIYLHSDFKHAIQRSVLCLLLPVRTHSNRHWGNYLVWVLHARL